MNDESDRDSVRWYQVVIQVVLVAALLWGGWKLMSWAADTFGPEPCAPGDFVCEDQRMFEDEQPLP